MRFPGLLFTREEAHAIFKNRYFSLDLLKLTRFVARSPDRRIRCCQLSSEAAIASRCASSSSSHAAKRLSRFHARAIPPKAVAASAACPQTTIEQGLELEQVGIVLLDIGLPNEGSPRPQRAHQRIFAAHEVEVAHSKLS